MARLLIVEDEWLIALECEAILSDAGHEVVGVAADAATAIQMAARERPDLALVDIKLRAGSDGIEVARELRDSWNIPAVFITSYRDARLRSRADKLGRPVGWLTKPYTSELLLNAVTRALAAN